MTPTPEQLAIIKGYRDQNPAQYDAWIADGGDIWSTILSPVGFGVVPEKREGAVVGPDDTLRWHHLASQITAERNTPAQDAYEQGITSGHRPDVVWDDSQGYWRRLT